MFICLHKGCTNSKKHAKGFCYKHYMQFYRHGKTFDITVQDLNEVVDKGNYYELILTDVQMKETGRVKIDKEDLEKVQAIGRWCLHNEGYVHNTYPSTTRMHRLIMDAKDDEYVDHKKQGFKSKSDNRKKNLRICSTIENSYNQGVNRTNTSGYKGVHWNKINKKWQATIKVKGKSQYLGQFNTAQEASAVYKKIAKKLHGKFYNKT